MKQPNILLIHCDQHRNDCVGVNGHPVVRTPSLDRLASEGVNFSHAFTPSPICSPARASLLTGQWPTQHGCMSIPYTEIYRPANDNIPIVTRELRKAGYWLGYVGKYHDEFPCPPEDLGFHVYESTLCRGLCVKNSPANPADCYQHWRESQGLPPAPDTNGWFGETDPYITPEQSQLAWGADRIISLMTEASKLDQPMLLRWDPPEPHLPCRPPKEFADMYPPESAVPWPSFADDLAGKPYIQAQQQRTWNVDGWTWEQWAPVVSRYYADISLLDYQVGRILDALEQLGMGENTLVIYTTDHGDMCGGHGMMDKHFVLYDDVVRVPLIMRYPGLVPDGMIYDGFVSHEIDINATLYDAAGLPIPETVEGHSLLRFLDGQDTPREDIFAMWQGGQFGLYSQRMVRDRQWKYVWNCTAEDEFYDVINDPGELRNRATDPACTGELSRMRIRLVDWMASIYDPLLNAWTKDQLLMGRKV